MAVLTLTQCLKELREFNNYTQDYVSRHLNIGRATYSNYELGKRTPPLDVVVDLADFYSISLDDLVRGADSDAAFPSSSQVLSLSADELQLLSLYRSLPDKAKEESLDFLRFKKANLP